MVNKRRDSTSTLNPFLQRGPVKIYRSRGPVQNVWGQGLFSCLRLMGLRSFFSNEHEHLINFFGNITSKIDEMSAFVSVLTSLNNGAWDINLLVR